MVTVRFASLVCMLLLASAAIGQDGLAGKVICGYQGWFRVPSDGAENGWHHYSPHSNFDEDHCSIDLWPDVSELSHADRFDTGFKYADGSVAQVFSSTRSNVVQLHFRWMQQYGIDGVFLQRFAVSARDERFRKPMDLVLEHVQSSARSHERQWALMYDLSGLKPEQVGSVMEDWKRIRQSHHVADAVHDSGYLRHHDKPLVALWGLGFSDREPMLDEWQQLIRFFRDEQCSIMIGVPTYWRTLNRDAISDPRLLELIQACDVVSPWTVGRYDSAAAVSNFADKTMAADIEWCVVHEKDYLPVVFPGFSWKNLSRMRGQKATFDAIPRRGGEFMWSQFSQFRRVGADKFYVAMFDELDEATAIMKFRSETPIGMAKFVNERDVNHDHYLWLTGRAASLLNYPIDEWPEQMPKR